VSGVLARLALCGALLAGAFACAVRSLGPPSPDGVVLPPLGPGRPQRVVLVSIEGLVPDAYRAAPGGASSMPVLAALAGAGAEAEAVEPAAPASVYPAHATLVTGELPARHGIPADRLLDERGVRRARYSHASRLRAPTLWQRAREAGLSVASLDWPSTEGAAIDLLLPDVEPSRRGETWLALVAEGATPRLAERVRALAAGEASPDAAQRDAIATTLACELVRDPAPPVLLLLRLSATGEALEASGPGSLEARAAFAQADAELGRLLGCLDAAGALAASALAVAGDRGLLPVHTEIHPNVVLARSQLLPGAGSLGRWSAIVRPTGGSALVYAVDEARAVEARRALEDAAAETRAFRVVSADELFELGSDPEAWFGLEATPGYLFGAKATGALLEPARRRGASGYLPGRREMQPAFVLWGRGVRPGVRIPWMRQSDVAPTLGRLLGVGLEGVDGRPVVGALEVTASAPRTAEAR
jgi:predicted AlkP superfamily pyrophosphatase or phosphodiesterase